MNFLLLMSASKVPSRTRQIKSCYARRHGSFIALHCIACRVVPTVDVSLSPADLALPPQTEENNVSGREKHTIVLYVSNIINFSLEEGRMHAERRLPTCRQPSKLCQCSCPIISLSGAHPSFPHTRRRSNKLTTNH